jgi:hypothetical protein
VKPPCMWKNKLGLCAHLNAGYLHRRPCEWHIEHGECKGWEMKCPHPTNSRGYCVTELCHYWDDECNWNPEKKPRSPTPP